MQRWKDKHNRGFTLIELLITISIIAILFSVVFAALNPIQLFAQSRNAKRWVSMAQLIDAIHLYSTQNNGTLPNQDDWVEGTRYVLGTNTTGCDASCSATTTASACLNLTDLITDKRMAALPYDPRSGDEGNSDIYIYRESGGIITAGICDNELDEVIAVSR